jgi:cytochrome c oxidase subunit 2
MTALTLFPEQASTEAAHTDAIYFGLIGFSVVVTSIVVGCLLLFALRYRRGSAAQRGELPEWIERDFEIGWTSAAFFLFIWPVSGQPRRAVPRSRRPATPWKSISSPSNGCGRRSHPNGAREINADVIHSFFAPELRVLPGRYARAWFNAIKVGNYHLLCTQLCGAEHARMTGEIVVMPRPDFAHWLAAQPHADDLVGEGRTLFASLGCSGCHNGEAKARAPKLASLYGQAVDLADGGHAVLDDAFIREIVLRPSRATPG